VLSIAKLRVGQEAYQLSGVSQSLDDYYTGRGEADGLWMGAGAERLGLSGVVVVAHGRSNAFAIRHAIRVAKQSVEQDILGKIQKGISEVEIEDAEAAASTQPAA